MAAHQGVEEVHHLRRLDGAGVEAEVKVPRRQPGGHRKRLPVEVVLQHRSLAARRPGAHPVRALAQSTFVDENDDAPFPAGFFLMAGHTFFFQCWISAWLRSRARPVGRCGLQPRAISSFQTWPG